MTREKEKLQLCLQEDNNYLRPHSFVEKLLERFLHYTHYELRRYLSYLRKQEYYLTTCGNSKIKGKVALLYERKKNSLGNRMGIEVGPYTFEEGLTLYHSNIVINPLVRGGKNCCFHGNNCVGNNGVSQAVPRLGSNVDVGFGAVIIGDITIADNVVIGANAVVNSSITEVGCTVAGIPARIIKHAGDENGKESSC